MADVFAPEPSPTISAPSDADALVLDAHTLRDLEIFGSSVSDRSLYQFCNLTKTDGGGAVLRRRMTVPWSRGQSIRATQESIGFIVAQREVFNHLPAAFTTRRVERYTREILPIVTRENLLQFTVGAMTLWANYDSHYLNIVRGVQFTCAMVRSLRQLAMEAEVASPVGELAELIVELRALLEQPEFARVPERRSYNWVWMMLRLDQGFRLHNKVALSRLLQITYEIDALVSMADVTAKQGFVMPKIDEGALRVQAEHLVHPYIHEAVANEVDLTQQRRVLFLTGPNMAGKTTYLRAFATAFYLAHLGMGVPAKSFRFVPAQRLFSSISLSDDLREGVSYFRAEALRVRAVAEAVAAGYRVVALMDEPFKGTNIRDAFDASLAILERFATKQGCLFIFSSHLIELSDRLDPDGAIDCRYFSADEREGRLHFDYQLRPGVSNQRLGMRVLREEGVFELLDAPRRREPR